MANPYSTKSIGIDQSEHIAPDKTGDNIAAKRVAGYVWNGTDWERQTNTLSSETFTKKAVTASASGNNTIHSPASGKKIRLYFFGYSSGSGVAGVLAGMRFGAAGTVFDNQYLVAAGQPYARNIQAGKRYIDGAVDEALFVNLSAAQTVYVGVELEEV